MGSRRAGSPSGPRTIPRSSWAPSIARLEPQTGSPAPRRITAIFEQLAVLDRWPVAGRERGLVRRAVGLALEIERALARQRHAVRRQPMHLEAAAARRGPNVRGQLAG